MFKHVAETVRGFNTYLKEQQALPGEATMEVILFSTGPARIHQPVVDIKTVEPLSAKTYVPDGGTALLDAIGTTIDRLGLRFAALPESERPSKVIVAITTDGEENSSDDYDQDKIKGMIEHQTKVYGWTILFTSSDIKSYQAASQLYGVAKGNTLQVTADSAGVLGTYKSLSVRTSSVRNA